jgi:hypothetical protein
MQGTHIRRLADARARLSLAAAAAAFLLAVAAPLPHAAAAPSANLAMNPPAASLAPGETLAVTVDLGGIDIHGIRLIIGYDPAVVEVIDADASASGTQILPGPFPGTDSEGRVLRNSAGAGTIDYEYALDGTDAVDGNGTVATVRFVAVANGSAALTWLGRAVTGAGGATITPTGATANIVVGANVVIADTPTATVEETSLPSATPTQTAAATSTSTPAGTATAQASATASRTATTTATPAGTASATPTVQITVLDNTNRATPTPVQPLGSVDPSQTERARGLPGAGNDGPGIAWWRWTFFLAALMLGFAGWFFTFAVHVGDRDVVLTDRRDIFQRRRYPGRRPPLR